MVLASIGLGALARWGVARPDGTLLWVLPWLPLAAIVAGHRRSATGTNVPWHA